MSEEKKNNHTLLKVLGVSAAAGAAAYAGLGYTIFEKAFDIQNSSYLARKAPHKALPLDGEVRQWYAHSKREDEFLDSFDGLKLHALRLDNNDSHKWIILVHGLGQYSASMINYLYEADHRGFNVLAVDQRGCGMSEGRYGSLGWNEHYDLISWINYLINLDPSAEIVLWGVNLGAAAVMNAVGDYIPSNVKCAVEEGGFSGIKEMLNSAVRKEIKVEGKVFFPMVDALVRKFLHFSMDDVSMKHQLEQSRTPILFAHGNRDEVVPTSMVFDNYYACASEKDLFVSETAGFAQLDGDPQFFKAAFEFIDKYIEAYGT